MSEKTEKQSLSGNTLWSLLGYVTNGGGRLLLFLLAAKFFSAEQAGLFFWALAVITPIVYFFNLELRLVYVTDTSDRCPIGVALALRVVGNMIAMILIVAFALYMARHDSYLSATLLILCGLTRATECFADSILGVMQKNEQMRQAAISYLARTSIVVVLALLAGLWHWPIWSIPLVWTLAIIIVDLTYEQSMARKLTRLNLVFDKAKLTQTALLSLPLGVFMAIGTLCNESGKYFIRHYLTNADVAYYSIAITVVNGLMMAQNGIDQGVLRRLSLYRQTDMRAFRKLLGKVLLIALALSLTVIMVFGLFGRVILAGLIKPEYATSLYDNGPILMIMLGGGLLITLAMVLGDAMVACQEFTGRSVSMFASLVINVILCYYLMAMRNMQLEGAAWAYVGSATTNLAVNIYYLIKRISEEKL